MDEEIKSLQTSIEEMKQEIINLKSTFETQATKSDSMITALNAIATNTGSLTQIATNTASSNANVQYLTENLDTGLIKISILGSIL